MPVEGTAAPASRLQRLLGYLNSDPRNLNLLVDAADAALAEGQASLAAELLDRAVKADPESPTLRYKLSNALLASGNFAGARELLIGLLAFEADPHPALLYNLAYAQLHEGLPADAVATLIRIKPEHQAQLPQYSLLSAKVLYWNGRLEDALSELQAYRTAHPTDREAPGLEAMLLLDLGRTAEAVAAARRLLQADEGDPTAHLVLGSAAVEHRDAGAARQHLSRVVERQPDAGRAWSGLGFTELLDSRLPPAREHFETATRLMPSHLGTWHGLIWTNILLGDLPAARRALDAAMAQDRNFAENHGTLAVLNILEGKPDEADQHIKRGLRLDPKSPSSHYARSLLLSARGDPAASLKLAERILSGAGLEGNEPINAIMEQLRASGQGAPMPQVPRSPPPKPAAAKPKPAPKKGRKR